MTNRVSSISFKSKIKLIMPKQFEEKVKLLPSKLHEVNYPWSPNETKTGKNLFTREIMDCVAGIITDGKTSKMFHQGNWTEEKAQIHSKKIFDISEMEKKLLEGMDLANKKIHAIFIGGFQSADLEFTDKIRKMFKKNNIPYTEFTNRKDVHHYGRFSLLYEEEKDTLYITNRLMGMPDLKGTGPEIDLKDSFVEFVTYGSAKDNYPVIRNKGTSEDFLKSQFRNVSVSTFDELI